jgi:hypothetical protein
MAIFGGYKKVDYGTGYIDRFTGKFISKSEGQSLDALGAYYRSRGGGNPSGLGKTITTLVDLLGDTPESASSYIAEYSQRYKQWKVGGEEGEQPEFISDPNQRF